MRNMVDAAAVMRGRLAAPGTDATKSPVKSSKTPSLAAEATKARGNGVKLTAPAGACSFDCCN